jgi:hypothetical protein
LLAGSAPASSKFSVRVRNPFSMYVPVFEQLVSQREVPLDGDPLYGKILNIGSEEGSPILTFTTGRHLTLNEPSESYLKEIAAGIRETYPQMSDDDITEYLLQADRVRGKIDLTKIQRLGSRGLNLQWKDRLPVPRRLPYKIAVFAGVRIAATFSNAP